MKAAACQQTTGGAVKKEEEQAIEPTTKEMEDWLGEQGLLPDTPD